ncbi:hypothetical protein DFJ74DRAFT_705691 [Hyaloraphidium curvatum]|nr:hypothetical protein DFJ74DRAFT_705691 [Hyaloraphidium curvatum]
MRTFFALVLAMCAARAGAAAGADGAGLREQRAADAAPAGGRHRGDTGRGRAAGDAADEGTSGGSGIRRGEGRGERGGGAGGRVLHGLAEARRAARLMRPMGLPHKRGADSDMDTPGGAGDAHRAPISDLEPAGPHGLHRRLGAIPVAGIVSGNSAAVKAKQRIAAAAKRARRKKKKTTSTTSSTSTSVTFTHTTTTLTTSTFTRTTSTTTQTTLTTTETATKTVQIATEEPPPRTLKTGTRTPQTTATPDEWFGPCPWGADVPETTVARCGKTFNQRCPPGECCTPTGDCRNPNDEFEVPWCNAECQHGYGRCRNATGTVDFSCATTTIPYSTTRMSAATPVYMACPDLEITRSGRCGPEWGNLRCHEDLCCGGGGWCQDDGGDSGKEWCGLTCQLGFGKCWVSEHPGATIRCPARRAKFDIGEFLAPDEEP